MPPNQYARLSTWKMAALASGASCGVLAVSLALQWFVYDDWLHRTGPLHFVGTSIAASLTFIFVLRWLLGYRQKQRETLARFEKIARMNDRIRNSLQAIECITYAADPSATDSVRQAVGAIDGVLKEVISDSTMFPQLRIPSRSRSKDDLSQKSASA